MWSPFRWLGVSPPVSVMLLNLRHCYKRHLICGSQLSLLAWVSSHEDSLPAIRMLLVFSLARQSGGGGCRVCLEM